MVERLFAEAGGLAKATWVTAQGGFGWYGMISIGVHTHGEIDARGGRQYDTLRWIIIIIERRSREPWAASRTRRALVRGERHLGRPNFPSRLQRMCRVPMRDRQRSSADQRARGRRCFESMIYTICDMAESTLISRTRRIGTLSASIGPPLALTRGQTVHLPGSQVTHPPQE
jgi:hypothetical protein